jgi:multiple sugar transport system permease protein
VLKRVLVYTILLVWTGWIAFPLYWMASLPFKRPQDVSGRTTYVPFIDFAPTTQALSRAFTPGSDASLALQNSLFVSIGSAAIALVLGAMAGYGLARFQYRIGPLTNDHVSLGFLSQRMFPVAVLAVPYLLLFRTLNLLDTPLAILIGEVGFATPLVAWLVRDFFRGLPTDVEESAMMDGCSRLGVLRHIVLPLSRPALGAAFLLIFLAAWNDYFLALVVTFSQSVTLPLYIQAHPMPSVILLSVIPPILVGFAAQGALTRGLSLGAVGRFGPRQN